MEGCDGISFEEFIAAESFISLASDASIDELKIDKSQLC